MADAGDEAVSLMLHVGDGAVMAAEDLIATLLEALRALGRNADEATKVAATAAIDKIDGHGRTGKTSLKNLAKHGGELVAIPIERNDLKVIESQLKAYKTTFALMEDPLTGDLSIHVKASDYSRIEVALSNVLKDMIPAEEHEADASQQEEAIESNAGAADKGQAIERNADTPKENAPAKEDEGDQAKKAEVSQREADAVVRERELKRLSALQREASLHETIAATQIHLFGQCTSDRAARQCLDKASAHSEAKLKAEKEAEAIKKKYGVVEPPSWSKPIPTRGGDGSVLESSLSRNGFTLFASTDGGAIVKDSAGSKVFSGKTVAGADIERMQKLAERGLEAHLKKDELALSDDSKGKTDKADKAFEESLVKAEARADVANAEGRGRGRSNPHRSLTNER